MILFVFSSIIIDQPADLDDLFHAGVEIVLLLLIPWPSWRWRDDTEQSTLLNNSTVPS